MEFKEDQDTRAGYDQGNEWKLKTPWHNASDSENPRQVSVTPSTSPVDATIDPPPYMENPPTGVFNPFNRELVNRDNQRVNTNCLLCCGITACICGWSYIIGIVALVFALVSRNEDRTGRYKRSRGAAQISAIAINLTELIFVLLMAISVAMFYSGSF